MKNPDATRARRLSHTGPGLEAIGKLKSIPSEDRGAEHKKNLRMVPTVTCFFLLAFTLTLSSARAVFSDLAFAVFAGTGAAGLLVLVSLSIKKFSGRSKLDVDESKVLIALAILEFCQASEVEMELELSYDRTDAIKRWCRIRGDLLGREWPCQMSVTTRIEGRGGCDHG